MASLLFPALRYLARDVFSRLAFSAVPFVRRLLPLFFGLEPLPLLPLRGLALPALRLLPPLCGLALSALGPIALPALRLLAPLCDLALPTLGLLALPLQPRAAF